MILFRHPCRKAAQKVSIIALLDKATLIFHFGYIFVDISIGCRLTEHAGISWTQHLHDVRLLGHRYTGKHASGVRSGTTSTMERALEAGVLTALGANWTPTQLLDHIRDLAERKSRPFEEVVKLLPDALLTIAFSVEPVPALAMQYLSTLCLASTEANKSGYPNTELLFVSLLRYAHANLNTAEQICAVLLQGTGDSLPFTTAQLAEKMPNGRIWPATFQILHMALKLNAPHSALAILFQRLTSQTYREPLPDTYSTLTREVESACTHNAAWSPMMQTLMALEQDPEDLAPRTNHAVLPDMWSSRQTLPFALGLAGAVHQLHTSGGRTPALPPAPSPEPETILLVYLLSSDLYSWAEKCEVAQSLLSVRLACADTEPEKARLAFYVELLIAVTHAAHTCINLDQASSSAWRGFVGGLIPPLLRFLDTESDKEAQRMLSLTLNAFVELYAPLSHWAAEEVAVEPALPEHILRCMASWGLVETHSSEAINANDVVRMASPDLQQYTNVVQAQITTKGGLAALAMQAASDPARQLCFAHVISTTVMSWKHETAEMEQVAEICSALSVPGASEALLRFMKRSSLCEALLMSVEALQPYQWQDVLALDSISTVLLFLQLIATPVENEHGPASVFLSYSQVPTLAREALSDANCELLDRWTNALVGSDGVSDNLLRYVHFPYPATHLHGSSTVSLLVCFSSCFKRTACSGLTNRHWSRPCPTFFKRLFVTLCHVF